METKEAAALNRNQRQLFEWLRARGGATNAELKAQFGWSRASPSLRALNRKGLVRFIANAQPAGFLEWREYWRAYDEVWMTHRWEPIEEGASS